MRDMRQDQFRYQGHGAARAARSDTRKQIKKADLHPRQGPHKHGPKGQVEEIAIRLEGKCHTAATSQCRFQLTVGCMKHGVI